MTKLPSRPSSPMTMARRAVIALPLVLSSTLLPVVLPSALLLLVLPSAVCWAFPVSVEIVGAVPRGQNPKLIITALDEAKQASVELLRDDGKRFTFPLGHMKADQRKEIALDGRAGRHSYKGQLTATINDEKMSSPLSFKTVVAAPMKLSIDRNELDLEARKLVFSASSAPDHVQLTIFDADGAQLLDQNFDVSSSTANQPVTLRWQGTNADEIVRLELRVTDQDGFFKGVALTPWSVNIPHEEVLFDTNSADIDASEEDKLQASLEEIEKTIKRFEQVKGVQLFIAGHTDTVGKPAHNANLSRRRAQAIGNWFVQSGVPIPVYFEGFGEAAPKVKTGDEVAEPKNRRVDYILSVEPPPLKSRAHGWKRLK